MTKPIINIAEVELQPRPAAYAAKGPAAERFDARMGQLSSRLGARHLGYNITAIPPGKRAFPLHNHRINEEVFLVLEGSGEVRIGDTTHPLRTGDIVACPPGGKETAHQFVNTGTAELKIFAVSTKLSPDICDYPDSGKFAVMAELPPGPDGKPQFFRFVGKEDLNVDYWQGE